MKKQPEKTPVIIVVQDPQGRKRVLLGRRDAQLSLPKADKGAGMMTVAGQIFGQLYMRCKPERIKAVTVGQVTAYVMHTNWAHFSVYAKASGTFADEVLSIPLDRVNSLCGKSILTGGTAAVLAALLPHL